MRLPPLPLLLLELLDPQDQLLDLVTLGLHALLLEPLRQVDGQVEAGDGILLGGRRGRR